MMIYYVGVISLVHISIVHSSSCPLSPAPKAADNMLHFMEKDPFDAGLIETWSNHRSVYRTGNHRESGMHSDDFIHGDGTFFSMTCFWNHEFNTRFGHAFRPEEIRPPQNHQRRSTAEMSSLLSVRAQAYEWPERVDAAKSCRQSHPAVQSSFPPNAGPVSSSS